jgi:hypothetical protein
MGESSNSLPPFLISEDIMPRVNWRYYIVEPGFAGPYDTEDDARSFALRNNVPGEIRIERLPTSNEARAKHLWNYRNVEEKHDYSVAIRRFKSIRSFIKLNKPPQEGNIVQ